MPRSREQRLAYHSRFVTIRTSAIDTLAHQARTRMILGRPRPSLIVTGPAAAGKTTAFLHVGRTCHPRQPTQTPRPARAPPPSAGGVSAGAARHTAKTLTLEFARYLGIPTARKTTAKITGAVCHPYTAAGVRLVLLDEIHRLNPRTTTNAQLADLLKDLTESLAATFIYAGIDVTATPCSPESASPSSPAAPCPPATAPSAPSPT
ncbi:TniB family NTP-binding protein [Streptomyces sp. NPDC045369]|uniref:TniB family NTP-binding protein n=1 Tax=Streptomyces sp. NPDC045369 TaxID=3155732 RepID=UPI0033C448D3